MKIPLEDVATIFASEIIKALTFKEETNWSSEGPEYTGRRIMPKDFLRMNFSRRKKIVSGVLDNVFREVLE